MKKIAAMALLMVIPALLFAGCVIQLGGGDSTAIQMSNSGNVESLPGTVTLSKGSKFEFSLEANMTTGYSWQVYIEDEEIVELISNEYVADEVEDEIEGSGGVAVITLEALKKGETTITLEYAQDWDGGEVDSTKEITVVVE